MEREGLCSLGDVGFVDADGFLYLCDRKRDMIISGGENIYPKEIELVLDEQPGVLESAVIGVCPMRILVKLCLGSSFPVKTKRPILSRSKRQPRRIWHASSIPAN